MVIGYLLIVVLLVAIVAIALLNYAEFEVKKLRVEVAALTAGIATEQSRYAFLREDWMRLLFGRTEREFAHHQAMAEQDDVLTDYMALVMAETERMK